MVAPIRLFPREIFLALDKSPYYGIGRQTCRFDHEAGVIRDAITLCRCVEASAREAKRCALRGDFGAADVYAKRALELGPGWPAYQERRRLIVEAKSVASGPPTSALPRR